MNSVTSLQEPPRRLEFRIQNNPTAEKRPQGRLNSNRVLIFVAYEEHNGVHGAIDHEKRLVKKPSPQRINPHERQGKQDEVRDEATVEVLKPNILGAQKRRSS